MIAHVTQVPETVQGPRDSSSLLSVDVPSASAKYVSSPSLALTRLCSPFQPDPPSLFRETPPSPPLLALCLYAQNTVPSPLAPLSANRVLGQMEKWVNKQSRGNVQPGIGGKYSGLRSGLSRPCVALKTLSP